MANKINFEQLLEYVVNGETAKADELFHQLVVLKSREIYENIIESELDDVDIDESSEEDEEEMDEATESDEEEMDESTEEEEMDENFGMEAMGGDETDDLMHDVGDEGDSDDDGMDMDSDDMDHDEEGEEDRISDLEDQLADLRAAFDSLMADEKHEPEHNDGVDDPDFGGEEDDEEEMDDEEDEGMMPGAFEEEIEAIDLSPAEQMREYVEKIGSWEKQATSKEGDEVAKGGRYTTNTKSVVASKNDMGGTAKNIAQGGKGTEVFANQGQLKGDGVLNGKPKDMNTGNVNKVGGTNTKQFYKANTKGHGAEKKGEAEGKLWGNGGSAGATNTKSLFK
jgi:hypothetical protein